MGLKQRDKQLSGNEICGDEPWAGEWCRLRLPHQVPGPGGLRRGQDQLPLPVHQLHVQQQVHLHRGNRLPGEKDHVPFARRGRPEPAHLPAAVGHGGPGEVPQPDHGLLQRRHGLSRALRPHQRAVLPQHPFVAGAAAHARVLREPGRGAVRQQGGPGGRARRDRGAGPGRGGQARLPLLRDERRHGPQRGPRRGRAPRAGHAPHPADRGPRRGRGRPAPATLGGGGRRGPALSAQRRRPAAQGSRRGPDAAAPQRLHLLVLGCTGRCPEIRGQPLHVIAFLPPPNPS